MNAWRTKLKVGLVVALLVASQSGLAQTTIGDRDCGQWIKGQSGTKTWLVGFLTGMNMAFSQGNPNVDLLRKLRSAEQAYLWMDNYCRANPLKMVSEGAIDLFLELQK